jgi:hypothetical protein
MGLVATHPQCACAAAHQLFLGFGLQHQAQPQVLHLVLALQALTPYEQQLAKLEAKYKKNNAKVGGQSVEKPHWVACS